MSDVRIPQPMKIETFTLYGPTVDAGGIGHDQGVIGEICDFWLKKHELGSYSIALCLKPGEVKRQNVSVKVPFFVIVVQFFEPVPDLPDLERMMTDLANLFIRRLNAEKVFARINGGDEIDISSPMVSSAPETPQLTTAAGEHRMGF